MPRAVHWLESIGLLLDVKGKHVFLKSKIICNYKKFPISYVSMKKKCEKVKNSFKDVLNGHQTSIVVLTVTRYLQRSVANDRRFATVSHYTR